MLKSNGPQVVRKLIEPEIAKLTRKINLQQAGTSHISDISHITSIKTGDPDHILQEVQDAIKALARFGSKEDISTALQMHKDKGINSLISYSKQAYTKAIEHKIQKDLQIMKNKFDPNYNLGNRRLCDILVEDFKGKSHPVSEDYLASIGKDKQVMQYISPGSEIGKVIKAQINKGSEVRLNQGIRV
ncbi:hypothetical protein [Rickettsia gravesii]|uniref:hypothetical protein n=1 Tax=Rickettsia gravesii TaxID=354585 RepID=UPI0004B482CB|nr:hypothetical protein [Rickettsia gravesii]